jgi:hypothetical protein
MCLTHLELTDGNILDLLTLAFQHDIEELKQKALDYTFDSRNQMNFESIFLSSDWLTLVEDNFELVKKILKAAFNHRELSK